MTTCPKCGAKLEPDWRFCMNCSTPTDPEPVSPAPPPPVTAVGGARQHSLQGAAVPTFTGYAAPLAAPMPVGTQRFRVLRFAANLLKVFAVIQLAGGVIIAVIAAVVSTGRFGTLVPGSGLGILAAIVLGLLGGLYAWAAGDFIMVALAVEENTRAIRLGVK